MAFVGRFARFWYDFLVGDDWLAAVGVAAALGLTALLTAEHNPWWLLPVAIALVLLVSVRRGVAAASRAPSDDATRPD